MGELILYGPIEAPYTRKVRAAFALKGVAYHLVEPRGPEDFRRWSPETGLLPVLEAQGQRIADSARILDWVESHAPDPPLVSPDALAAHAQRRLERWVEDTLHFYWEHSLRHQAEGVAGARAEALAREFADRLDDLVNFLGRRPYFYGEHPSRADLAVFGFLGNLPTTTSRGVAARVESRAALRDHVRRVAECVREREWPEPRPFVEPAEVAAGVRASLEEPPRGRQA